MIKVGDKVRIKQLEICQKEYKRIEYIPFGYNRGMKDYFGTICTISNIHRNPRSHEAIRYEIKEDGGFYMWHPSLFEKGNDVTRQVFDVLMGNTIELNLDKKK